MSRTKELLAWAKDQPWWTTAKAAMEAGMIVTVHTPEGPPEATIRPDRLSVGSRVAAAVDVKARQALIVAACDAPHVHLLIAAAPEADVVDGLPVMHPHVVAEA